MADVVEMIQLSPTMDEGLIVEWMKQEGDEVETGDIIAEVETDKATMEMESFFDGVILKILVDAGEAAPVGRAIAIIGEEGEDISEVLSGLDSGAESAKSEDSDAEQSETTDEPAAADSDEEERTSEEAGPVDEAARGQDDVASTAGASAPAAPSRSGERIKSSPLARKIAADKGIALEDVEGSGPGGRIIRRDVEAASVKAPEKASGTAHATAPIATPDELAVGGEDVALSQMRKTIAKRLTEAWQAPAFMLTRTLKMERLMALRKEINGELEDSESETKISVNDMLIRACGLALRDVPEMNAAFFGDGLRLFESADIGVAVAIDGGLITPVVRRAHEKSVGAIAREGRDLFARAREKKLAPEEFTNSTFSISNLGMMGIEHFTAVLNPPAAGILAVGAVRTIPVVTEDGELAVGQRMSITLTCDHRAVDGATGASFLQALAGYVERPMTLLV